MTTTSRRRRPAFKLMPASQIMCPPHLSSVLSYMQSIGNFHCHYARSDGCKCQFKCAQHIDWISRQQTRHGIRMDWRDSDSNRFRSRRR